MESLRFFSEISKEDTSLAGGKGASLGEMTQAGISVPEGFVVLSTVFSDFVKENKLDIEIDSILSKVNHEEVSSVDHASEEIQALIKECKMSDALEKEILNSFNELNCEYVAVRSSATSEDSADAAWAGQLDTFLNTTSQTLIDNVKNCWASLFTPRAIYYRFEKELHETEISVAVVVQKMIQSEVSGIAFSVHPITEDYNQLIIEAGEGLGEAVVSGSITPDSYVVEKDSKKVIEKSISHQSRKLVKVDNENKWVDINNETQKISDEMILELSKLIIKIENHYGFPCDIEWALENDKLYITQSRPITTLSNKEGSAQNNMSTPDQKNYTFMWSTTPLMICYWSTLAAFKEENNIFPTADCFMYFDGNVITSYIPEEDLEVWRKEESPKYLDKEYYENYIKEYEEECKFWWNWLRKVEKKSYDSASKEELKEDFEMFVKIHKDAIAYFGSTRPEFTFQAEQNLIEIIKEKFSEDWTETFSLITTPSFLDDIQKEEIERVKIFETGATDELITEHLSKFPWLVFGQFDNTRAIEFIKSNPPEEKSYEKIVQEFESKFKERSIEQEKLWKDLGDEAKYLSKFLQEQAVRRMDIKSVWGGLYYISKNLILKVADEVGIDANELVGYYLPEEIVSALDNSQRKISEDLDERKKNHAIMYNKGDKEIILLKGNDAKDKFEELILPPEIKDTIEGQCASTGKYKGKVRKVVAGDLEMLEKNIELFQEGEVLVTSMTQPNMMVIANRAGAIIADEGGITSHAAIISRELKIPCLVGCLHTMEVLEDGDLVEVDANNGVVNVIERVSDKQELIIDGKEWITTVTRNMSFFHQYIANPAYASLNKKFHPLLEDLGMITLTKEGTQTTVFIYGPEMGGYSQAIEKLILDKQNIVELKENYIKYGEELKKSLEILKNDLSIQNWKDFVSNYQLYCTGLFITTIIGRKGEELLVKRLTELKYQETEIHSLISTITYPDENTPMFNSQLDLLEIGTKIQKDNISEEERDKLLGVWLGKYENIPVNFCEEPWTLEDAKKQLNELLKKDCSKQLELSKKEHEKKIQDAKDMIEKIGDSTIENLAYSVAQGTYLNEYRKNIFSRVSLEYRPVFEKIVEMSGSNNWRDVFYLTPQEVEEILNGVKLDLEKIKKEREYVALYSKKDPLSQEFLEAEDTNELKASLEKLHSSKNEDSSENQEDSIKGFSANKGVVRGTAKVVLNSKEFSKVNDGDILVSTMTSVDFVPIMEKAAAFVTNEGGITCHASIVAREMNKPCIIGTQIATQFINDGDLVEVNANNGIIKKINNDFKSSIMNKELIFMGEWPSPPIETSLWLRWDNTIDSKNLKLEKLGKDPLYYIDGNYYYNARGLGEEIKEKCYDEFKSNSFELSSEMIRISEALEKDINDLIEKYKENYSDINFIKESLDFHKRIRFPWWALLMIDFAVEKFLSEKCEENNDNIEEIVKLMPSYKTFVQRDNDELENFKQKLSNLNFTEENFNINELEKKDQKLKEEFESYQKETEFFGTHHFWGEPRTTPKFVKDIFDVNVKEEPESEIPKEYEGILKISGEMAKWRLDLAFISGKLAYKLKEVFKNKAESLGFQYDDIIYLTSEEIVDLFENRLNLDKNLIEDRKKGFCSRDINNRTEITTGEQVSVIKQFVKGDEDINNDKKDIIEGKIGNKGITQGKVAIVKVPSDFSKVDENSILVTSETTPDFLPIMNKALAFVTDRGGITSHAAIIAREMDKPCVIGTKVATQVLSDNDLVEVDANKGIVRKL